MKRAKEVDFAMKIAQVCPRYFPYIGGVETHVSEISRRLARKGFEVEVLTTDPKGELPKEEVVNDVKIKRFKSWAPNEAYYFSKDLERYLAENSENYDVVHAHSYHAFPALYATRTKRNNKLVFNPFYHGTGHTLFRRFLHIPYKFIGGKIFRKADCIICVSTHEKNLIVRHFTVNEEKVKVIPSGLDQREFDDVKNLPRDVREILYVGRLEEYKGVQYVIKALARLDESVTLRIVGEGSYKGELFALAKKLGVENRVRFCGSLPHDELLRSGYYAKAGLFILLSKYESFGISVAEALASGTPCIVANTSALREWVDGKNCFGIDYPINIEELAYMINKVMGKKLIDIQLPIWDDCIQKLISVYEGVLVRA